MLKVQSSTTASQLQASMGACNCSTIVKCLKCRCPVYLHPQSIAEVLVVLNGSTPRSLLRKGRDLAHPAPQLLKWLCLYCDGAVFSSCVYVWPKFLVLLSTARHPPILDYVILAVRLLEKKNTGVT